MIKRRFSAVVFFSLALSISSVALAQENSLDQFWEWFKNNRKSIEDSYRYPDSAAYKNIYNSIQMRLKHIDSNIAGEFALNGENSKNYELVISANGIKESIPAVQKVISAAPKIKNWKFTAFRQPSKDADKMSVEIDGVELAAKDIWFREEITNEADNAFGLTLYLKGLTRENSQDLQLAVYLLLDHKLGEYEVMTKVSWIKWGSLPENPAASGLKPFSAISNLVRR